MRNLRISAYMLAVFITALLFGCRLTDPGSKKPGDSYIYRIGELETLGTSYAVSVSSRKAYIADGAHGLLVVDIESPNFPVTVDHYEGSGIVWDVKTYGDFAYLASGESGLEVIDIESPFGIEKAGSYNTDSAFGLDIAGDYVYLADGMSGVRILDVSQPYSLRELSRIHVEGQIAYSVKLDWPYLYVGTKHGFSILNVDNPHNPYEVHHEDLREVYSIDVADNKAYIAFYGGLRIYDIRDKRRPELLSEKVLISPARSIIVRGDFAYLTLGSGGLSVIRIADPKRPYEVEWYNPTGSEMNQAAFFGRYLCIADGGRGLVILEFWPGY